MWHGRLARVKNMPKLPKYEYRRNLPHFQKDDRVHFITFSTRERWILPKSVRTIVLDACLHFDQIRMEAHAAVVMPDHVHLIATPLRDGEGHAARLFEILHSIKSFSAHGISAALHRNGPVWLDESFDHVLRSEEKVEEKIEYLRQNPVRRGLVKRPDEYQWLWTQGSVHST